ncbi:A disintegrin and metalloproteinase with thrombospondin motifs adt-1-like [Ruditapes philippinarum]|uniref:A disintegrin and metalloproteinase with thrombospondin motifs adt-1-like n=1 Tax=Ruditapes philippinarum TaxID=129788 RepID=UPI00295AB813|nr:A disintegrin and metalloproteinase with thrombospondin motifs adt-1-like [Ruditapes philippinarum]
MHSLYLPFLVLLGTLSIVDCLECYSCSGVSSVNNCISTTQCRTGQSCYTNSFTSGQDTKLTMGCTNNEQCGIQSGIVGRDVSERETSCHECCSTERCNYQLCIHFKPTTCMDDVKVDCAYLNAMFNICKDIQHSKNVCPKFCGLCTLVDGNWAEWSQWSACDVTCEKGLQTRKRTCTNPAPAHHGLDCVGNKTDTKTCLNQPCPIHGGWTGWENWGACSVTCDVGVQRRVRNCTNPYPSRFGDHCFGDPLEYKICMQGPCTNGGWSTWGTWTTCSATCDGGLRSRFRNCTNPSPSLHGQYCAGPVTEMEDCNQKQCVSEVVFLAHALSTYSVSSGERFIFTTNLVNVGGAYSNANGYFTAPVGGSYSFSYQFCFSTTGKHMYVNIMINNTYYSASHYYEAQTNVCNSSKIFVYLKKGDRVWVKCHSATSGTQLYENSQHMNTFSGILIRT